MGMRNKYHWKNVVYDWAQSLVLALVLAVGLFILFQYMGMGFESLPDKNSVIGSFLAFVAVGFFIVILAKSYWKNQGFSGSKYRS